MRKSTAINYFALMYLLLMPSSSFAIADSSHGLSWGVEEGHRLDYEIIQEWYTGRAFINSCYIIISSLKSIPDNITSLSSIFLTSENFDMICRNINCSDIPTRVICGYPVGNSSFILDLMFGSSNSNDEIELINSNTVWGYIRTESHIEPWEEKWITQYTYSQSDGILEKFSQEWYRPKWGGNKGYYLVSRTTVTRTEQMRVELLSIVFVMIVASVISIIVIYLYKRENR